jgi:hypothetical protein
MVAKSAAAFTSQFAARHDVWFTMAVAFLGAALEAYRRIHGRKYRPVKLVKDLLLSALAGIAVVVGLLILYFVARVVYLPVQQAHQLAQLVPTNQKCQDDLTQAHSEIDKLNGQIQTFSQLRAENANLLKVKADLTNQIQSIRQEEDRWRANDLGFINELDAGLGQYMGLVAQIKNNCATASARKQAADVTFKQLDQARQQAKQQKRFQPIDERAAWREAAQQLTRAQDMEQQCDKIPNDLVDSLTRNLRFLRQSRPEP